MREAAKEFFTGLYMEEGLGRTRFDVIHFKSFLSQAGNYCKVNLLNLRCWTVSNAVTVTKHPVRTVLIEVPSRFLAFDQ